MSPSTSPEKKAPGKRPMGVFILLTAASAMMFLAFVFVGLIPAIRWFQVQSYRETMCTVISSTAKVHTRSQGKAFYTLDMLYTYDIAGKSWRGTEYDVMEGGDGSQREVENLVANYPPGKQVSCYVDPTDPSNAYIIRTIRMGSLVTKALVTLIFALLFGVFAIIVIRRPPKDR